MRRNTTPPKADGAFLDGAQTYKLHVAPDIPVGNFWSVVVYDALSRPELENSQPLPSVSRYTNSKVNADGSIDIFFGPEEPKERSNWIKTIAPRLSFPSAILLQVIVRRPPQPAGALNRQARQRFVLRLVSSPDRGICIGRVNATLLLMASHEFQRRSKSAATEESHVRKIAPARRKSVFNVFSLTACLGTIAWSSTAFAEGSSRPNGGGGPYYPTFDAIIRQYNQSGELFRIEGRCQSNCTTFLAIRNVCVDPDATLLFHANLSRSQKGQPPDPKKNQLMLSHYNAKLRNFVVANHYMDSFEFHAISGHDIVHRFGYRQCPSR